MDTAETDSHGIPIHIIAKATEVAMRSKIRRERSMQLLFVLVLLAFWSGVVIIPRLEIVFPFIMPVFSKTLLYPFSIVGSMCLIMIYINDQEGHSDVQENKINAENYAVLRGNEEWWLVYKPDGRAFPLLSEPPESPFLKRAKTALIDR